MFSISFPHNKKKNIYKYKWSFDKITKIKFSIYTSAYHRTTTTTDHNQTYKKKYIIVIII